MVQFVFPSATGGPLCDDNFHSRVFCKPIELADAPRFRFRDIRHTFASLLLLQGESVQYVKEQMQRCGRSVCWGQASFGSSTRITRVDLACAVGNGYDNDEEAR
ncbi:MAG: hypothetical protein IIC02_09260 [Planctomycetes bacterium]|nr:hypothetical protein [Planctomycetota bacterium]